MRKLSLILFLSLFGFQLYGQVVNLGDAELATKIKKSTKPYKVVYILCDYLCTEQCGGGSLHGKP